MLISDSLPQMWMIYFGLAAVVLITGYLAIRVLPRFLRWIIFGAVAGMIVVPTGFHVTASVPEDSYSGTAPAIVAFAVSVIQKEGGSMASSFAMLVLGVVLGVAAGLVIWWLGRGREQRRRAAQRQTRHSHDDDHDDVELDDQDGLDNDRMASRGRARKETPLRAATARREARDRQEPSL